MEGQISCMVMRISLDCNSCCRKLRRNILNMKEIEKHLIEKQHNRVSVCGRFRPADVAIKLRKKMRRRVEILEIEEMTNHYEPQEEETPIVKHYKYYEPREETPIIKYDKYYEPQEETTFISHYNYYESQEDPIMNYFIY
nr:heavy metal-associated domain, HMA [Tanacetum cinerariifolium]